MNKSVRPYAFHKSRRRRDDRGTVSGTSLLERYYRTSTKFKFSTYVSTCTCITRVVLYTPLLESPLAMMPLRSCTPCCTQSTEACTEGCLSPFRFPEYLSRETTSRGPYLWRYSCAVFTTIYILEYLILVVHYTKSIHTSTSRRTRVLNI